MCGRFSLTATPEEVAELFDLDAVDPFPSRYNIAPTQPVLMIVNGPNNQPVSQLVRWGLVPSWVKEPENFTLLINARSETVIEKPSFRNAMRHRRTLVPASGFYEWHRPADKSQPKQAYWIKPRRSDGVIAFAGLMETWSSPNGSEIDSGCILTTEANPEFARIHHRLPVVIRPEDFERWLDCRNYEPRDMADLLKPVEDDFFEIIPVSDKVNKVANMGPDIQQRIDPAEQLAETSARAEKSPKPKSGPKPDDDQFKLF